MAREKKVKQLKTKKPSLADFVFLMTVGVLFAWSLFLGVINPTIFRLGYMISLVRMFAAIGILGLIFSNKRSLWIGIGLFAAFSIFVASGFVLTPEYPNMANAVAESLTNTIRFITGYRSHADLYEMIAVWTIFIAISLYVVIFSYFRSRFLLLFTGAAIIFAVAVTSNYFTYTRSFYVFVFSVLVLLIRELHQKNATHEVNSAPFTKYILALTALSLLIASILPIPSEGFAEGFFQNAVQRPFNFINDIVADLTQRNEFSLRQVGFGGSGRLGGDIALNDNLFMRIRLNRRDPIYLTGAVMDTYTGYSWVNRFNDEIPVDFNDISQNLELVEYALWNELRWIAHLAEIPIDRFVLLRSDDEFFDDWHDQGWYDPYLRLFRDDVTEEMIWTDSDSSWERDLSWFHIEDLISIQIDVLDLRPLSAFHTGIVRHIDTVNNDDISFLRDRDGRFFANQRMSRDTRYFVRAIAPNHQEYFWEIDDDNNVVESGQRSRLAQIDRGWFNNVANFITAFREFHGYDVSMISTFRHNETIISIEDLLNDYMIPRINQIHDMYTALPDGFPERVHELAREITEDATNDYDRMRLLEAYLRENFTYTLTPGSLPRNRDFVDHFLFDIRQGYCVHFATAFVTMARSLGMPARYLEGFLVHTGLDVMRDDGFIDVLNNMAHAWAEVYFEGFGWVRFEPTPPSGLPQEPNISGGTGGAGGGSPDPEEYEEAPPGSGNVTPRPPGSEIEQAEEDEFLTSQAWILIGIGSILIIIRIVFVHIKIKQAKYKANNQAVIHYFSTMLSYFKIFKFEMQETETAKHFATRICQDYFNVTDDYGRSLLKESINTFEKARYSNLSISNEERRVVEKLIAHLDARIECKSRLKYFYCRYVRIKH